MRESTVLKKAERVTLTDDQDPSEEQLQADLAEEWTRLSDWCRRNDAADLVDGINTDAFLAAAQSGLVQFPEEEEPTVKHVALPPPAFRSTG